MPRNVEIKARVKNVEPLLEKVKELSSGAGKILTQEDTFFKVPNGRLKLRDEHSECLDNKVAWLIHYHRANTHGPRVSQYKKCTVSDSEGLKNVLEDALGECGVVRKVRHLYMVGQTRVHIDTVEDLGSFMELEVVLEEGQSEAMGQEIAKSLMKQLSVSDRDLVATAYTDLLKSESGTVV